MNGSIRLRLTADTARSGSYEIHPLNLRKRVLFTLPFRQTEPLVGEDCKLQPAVRREDALSEAKFLFNLVHLCSIISET